MFKSSIIAAASTDGIADLILEKIEAHLPTGISFGACPEHSVQEDFDFKGYTGIWYQGAINKAADKMQGGSCTFADYELVEDGRISVDNSQQKGQPGSFEPRHHITGYAWPADPNADDGHLKVKLAGMPFAGGYDVLKTDYTSHAVIYSCFDVKFLKYE